MTATATVSILPRKTATRPPNIKTTMTYVTPEMASDWLSKNNAGNRKVIKPEVALLRSQIETGLYHTTHQGIGFYEDGSLADGQHRLMAIVEAGIGIWINVTTGLERVAVHAIDGGKIRSNLDRLHFLGVQSDTHRVSTCNCLISQYKSERAGRERWKTEKLASQEFEEFYRLFLDSIEFVMSFKRPDRCPSPLSAAVASAWFTEDRDRLGEFMLVMASGESTSGKDRAAIRLRDHINQGKYGAGSPARNDLFLRCCGAIRYFLDGRPLMKLYAIPAHAFPLVGYISGEQGEG
jgi:hypothetical protein